MPIIAQVILARALEMASLSPPERIIWTAPQMNIKMKARAPAAKKSPIILSNKKFIPCSPRGTLLSSGGGLIVPNVFWIAV